MEEQDLRLALAGIWTTGYRVLRAILTGPPGFGHPLLTLLVAVSPGAMLNLASRIDPEQDEGSRLLRLAADRAALLLLRLVTVVLNFQIAVCCTHVYVSLVALLYYSTYCFGVDPPRAARRVPRADPLITRLRRAFLSLAVPVLTFYTGAAWIALRQLDAPGEVNLLPQLMGGAAYIAGAGCITVACQLACVVWVLEDAWLFGGMWGSRALVPYTMFLFLGSAIIFLPLYGCITSGMALWALVGDYALGLRLAFQLPVALCAVLVITLMAQPLVYRECKKPARLD